MSGRRRMYGGLGAAVDLYGEATKRRLDEQTQMRQEERQFGRQTQLQDRAFQRNQTLDAQREETRARHRMALQAMKLGQAPPAQGQPPGPVTPGVMPRSPSVQPRQAAVPFLTQPQTDQLLAEARPGTPLPAMRENLQTGEILSNVPLSPAGINTMNRAISSGMTESPSVQRINQPPPPSAQAPRPPPPQPGLMQQMQRFLGPPRAAASPADPIAQRIEALRAQGMPEEQIAQFMREKGLDPSRYGLP